MKKLSLIFLFIIAAMALFGQQITINLWVDDYSFYGPEGEDPTGWVAYFVEAGPDATNDGVDADGAPAGDDYYPSNNVGARQILDTYGDTGNLWPNSLISQTVAQPEPYINCGEPYFWRIFNATTSEEATMYCDSAIHVLPSSPGIVAEDWNAGWGEWTELGGGGPVVTETIVNVTPADGTRNVHPDAIVSWSVASETREYNSFQVAINDGTPFMVTDPNFKLSDHGVAFGDGQTTISIAAYFATVRNGKKAAAREAGVATTITLYIANNNPSGQQDGHGNGNPNGTNPVNVPIPPVEDDEGNPVTPGGIVFNPGAAPAAPVQVHFTATPGNFDFNVPAPEHFVCGFSISGGGNEWLSGDIEFDYGQDPTGLGVFFNNGAQWFTLVQGAATDGYTILGTVITIRGLSHMPTSRVVGEAGIAFGSGDLTLPVELSGFSATFQATQSMVALQWVTASETNMVGYNVLRAESDNVDEAINLNATSIIEAVNSSNEHTYSFSDREIENGATYHYWLRATDLAGTVTQFGPTTVEIPAGGDNNEVVPVAFVSAYPNPFNSKGLKVGFRNTAGEPTTFKIYNIRGQLVESVVKTGAGESDATFTWAPAKNVASGVYFIRMETESKTEAKKVLYFK